MQGLARALVESPQLGERDYVLLQFLTMPVRGGAARLDAGGIKRR